VAHQSDVGNVRELLREAVAVIAELEAEGERVTDGEVNRRIHQRRPLLPPLLAVAFQSDGRDRQRLLDWYGVPGGV
jgi:hypothetical protein